MGGQVVDDQRLPLLGHRAEQAHGHGRRPAERGLQACLSLWGQPAAGPAGERRRGLIADPDDGHVDPQQGPGLLGHDRQDALDLTFRPHSGQGLEQLLQRRALLALGGVGLGVGDGDGAEVGEGLNRRPLLQEGRDLRHADAQDAHQPVADDQRQGKGDRQPYRGDGPPAGSRVLRDLLGPGDDLDLARPGGPGAYIWGVVRELLRLGLDRRWQVEAGEALQAPGPLIGQPDLSAGGAQDLLGQAEQAPEDRLQLQGLDQDQGRLLQQGPLPLAVQIGGDVAQDHHRPVGRGQGQPPHAEGPGPGRQTGPERQRLAGEEATEGGGVEHERLATPIVGLPGAAEVGQGGGRQTPALGQERPAHGVDLTDPPAPVDEKKRVLPLLRQPGQQMLVGHQSANLSHQPAVGAAGQDQGEEQDETGGGAQHRRQAAVGEDRGQPQTAG